MINNPQLERRRNYLFENVNINNKKGLEIGPYDRPIVLKSVGCIKYLDYYSTEELKRKNGKGRIPDEIVAIDYVMKGKSLEEVVKESFDYIVASHVVEHVPNLIAWLNQLHQILTDKGVLFFAIPDKRFTFDVCRPISTTGQIIQNFLTDKKQPSYGDVFDVHRYHRRVNCRAIWRDKLDIESIKPTFTLSQSLAHAEKSISVYRDCHCNVFTSEKFIEIINDLIELKFIKFKIKAIRNVDKDFNDFLCILEKN